MAFSLNYPSAPRADPKEWVTNRVDSDEPSYCVYAPRVATGWKLWRTLVMDQIAGDRWTDGPRAVCLLPVAKREGIVGAKRGLVVGGGLRNRCRMNGEVLAREEDYVQKAM
jgi:hypothetical protein